LGPWTPSTFKLRSSDQASMLESGTRISALKVDKHGMLMTRIDNCRAGTTYRLRIKGANENGESKWSDEVEVSTEEDDGPDLGYHLPPLPWLLGAASTIAQAFPAEEDDALQGYISSVANVLTPRVASLRRAFGYYTTGRHITQMQFNHIIKEAGMMQGCSSAQQTQSGATKLMEQVQVDLLFQRLLRMCKIEPSEEDSKPTRLGASLGGNLAPSSGAAQEKAPAEEKPHPPPEKPSVGGTAAMQEEEPTEASTDAVPTDTAGGKAILKAFGKSKASLWKRVGEASRNNAAAELRKAAETHYARMVAEASEEYSVLDDGVDIDPAGIGMAPFQFVAALIEVSWVAFPHLPSLGERLAACVDAILAVALPIIDAMRAKRAELKSPRVAAIFEHFDKDIKAIFRSYAAANTSAALAHSSTLDTLDLDELTYMLKEGEMIDDGLSVVKLNTIFAEANAGGEEGGADDDADELVYEEFISVLAMICDAKVPVARRSGEPFEFTLHAWLLLVFLPVYKRLLKEKAKGNVKKVIK